MGLLVEACSGGGGSQLSSAGTFDGGDATSLVGSDASSDASETADALIEDAKGKDVASVPVGIPFGPYNLYGGGEAGPSSWETPMSVGTASFTLSSDYADATGIVLRINSARQRKLKMLTHMTGGSHSIYITNGKFDLAKWKAGMDTYKTSAIMSAVSTAVADGTIIGNSVMDEPNHDSWGGVMTKAIVDQMCAYQKGIFPTLPAGVVHNHDALEPTKSYAVCDFIVDQYGHRLTMGDIAAFRDAALALGTRDHHAIFFSLNILDGGIQDTNNNGAWECPTPSTEGQGTYSPNCRMTADQVRTFGLTLGAAGCGLTMWRYDAAFMARADNQAAFLDVAASLALLPMTTCKRW